MAIKKRIRKNVTELQMTWGDAARMIGNQIGATGNEILQWANEARSMSPAEGKEYLKKKLGSRAVRKMIGLKSVK